MATKKRAKKIIHVEEKTGTKNSIFTSTVAHLGKCLLEEVSPVDSQDQVGLRHQTNPRDEANPARTGRPPLLHRRFGLKQSLCVKMAGGFARRRGRRGRGGGRRGGGKGLAIEVCCSAVRSTFGFSYEGYGTAFFVTFSHVEDSRE